VSQAAQLPKLGPVIRDLSVLVLYDVYLVGMQLVNHGRAALTAKGGAAEVAADGTTGQNTSAATTAAAAAASTTGGAGNSAMVFSS